MAAQTPQPVSGQPLTTRLGGLTLVGISLIGAAAYVLPFVVAVSGADVHRVNYSLLIAAVLIGACFVVLFASLGPTLSSKAVALLGVLVAINAILRAVDVSFLPSGEFSPIFLLIGLVGYIFGAQLGFLMGALTMLTSALITGGVGPWLPYQMITAGWMGMTAAWLPRTPDKYGERAEIWRLAIFGLVWGYLYGLIINLYDWPLLSAQLNAVNAEQAFQPGASLADTMGRYAAYYAALSFVPDTVRALGNAALLLVMGLPLLRVFRRFRARFEYHVVETLEVDSANAQTSA